MDDDAPLDPAASAALIAEQRAKVEAAMDVDARVLFGAWGVAWLVGFTVLWLRDLEPPVLRMSQQAGMMVFAALLFAAGGVTAWHLAVKGRGIRGASARQGAMYGWSWSLSFGVVGALAYALARAGASEEVMGVAMMITSLLVVGALYMAGGALWEERIQWALGAWICLATIVAAVVGLPHMYLVMAVGGGGGLLVGAAADGVRRRRARVV
jgi:hypothetical protein